jgi:Ino eighty subunit 2
MDTINRLLKKQAPKRRGRFPVAETAADATPDVPPETEKPDPTMIRWISNRDTCKLAVPEEILGTPVAYAFGELSGVPSSGRKLVKEV